MARNNINAIKTKTFALEVKAIGEDDEGTVEGYASVFGVRDSYNEVVMPGAFSDSMAKHRREGTFPLMLWQHDHREVIGKWEDFSDDGKGLYSKGRILLGLQRGRETHILLKERAVSGVSIGYRETDVEPAVNGEPRKLIKLELMEASIVSFPANRRARIDSVKSEVDCALEDLARRIRDGETPPTKEFEEILRDAGFPKALANQLASVGYAKTIRREADGDEANERAIADAMTELRKRLDGFTIP